MTRFNYTMRSGADCCFGEPITILNASENKSIILFFSEEQSLLENILKTQVRLDQSENWLDYYPGKLLNAQRIECRVMSPKKEVVVHLVVETN